MMPRIVGLLVITTSIWAVACERGEKLAPRSNVAPGPDAPGLVSAVCEPQKEPPPTEDEAAAKQVLEQFLLARRKGDSATMYRLFSARFKDELKQTFRVGNVEQYKEFHAAAETEWLEARLIEFKYAQGKNFCAVVKNRLWAEGREDELFIRYSLVKDRAQWRIDKWDYVKPEVTTQR